MKTVIKQVLRSAKNYIKFLKYKKSLPKNPMHDDIYLVEFPKSGVTWLQHILANIELQLLGRGEEVITFYNHHKYSPDVHQLRGANINRFLKRTFIKTHAEYNPYYYFVIYLLRNPIDVLVSYYNFLLDSGEKISFEKFVKSDKGIKAWKRHVNSWYYKRIDAQRIHFIKYEDLIKDTAFQIKNLYKNLGVNLSDEIINIAIQRSNLEQMMESEEHYRKYNPNYTMSFVGKRKKLKKEELVTEEIKRYILKECREEIEQFYPELELLKKNEQYSVSTLPK